MATELPAQGGGADGDAVDGRFGELVAEGEDLDAELGDDIALDEEETAA